ncbi:MAG: sulfite oxidase heme-binding subunit YedZ [Pyrinomonadaceae bacterium]
MPDIKFARVLVFINSLVPLSLLALDLAQGRLGANPLEFVTRTTGMLALVFLLLSLSVTPLRKFTGINWLIKFRRMIGLYAFFYAALHFLTYVWFDKSFNFKSIVSDIFVRWFIAVGMLTFFLLVPLAVTSTNGMIKRLGGKRWNQLHKLVYVAGAGGVLHYYMLVKSDANQPLLFIGVLTLLLMNRLLNAQAQTPTLSIATAGGSTLRNPQRPKPTTSTVEKKSPPESV